MGFAVVGRSRTVWAVAVLFLAAIRPSFAMDPAKRADIVQLMTLTGDMHALENGLLSKLPQIMDQIRKRNAQIPDDVWAGLRQEGEEIFKKALPDFEEPFIVMYDDNYSPEEIKQLLAFFDSPVGRKMVTQQARLYEQGYAVGKVWGERVTRQIVEHIRESARKKGYEL